ncbi:aminodeoxychorismate/anthranilate synthase component II [Gloeocapsa sp. PCC 73106]|uniref:anthranilate synthase component II n=1 Tax=Gloeocapsa sp. PCC 73106 TaxID=102232 RepID=UPI0002ABF9FC|nr:aminodeoxychorismate/anthranilate synthase component II [Gloeocapsa sp. PCC 73106]ELR96825.1 glutamine amidotransferase of anthranilate synthase or aminodeoxychorismate synthase [Gloeocapsa sp. PCC 73106]
MIIVIDNYDSFTYNLVQYLGELSQKFPIAKEIKVYRNDQVDIESIIQAKPGGIVISPGPGRPEDSGICPEIIALLGPKVPILGVCLGHQSIGQVFGGKIVNAPTLMHGKTSEIYHQGVGVFANLHNPITATRYHSLIVAKDNLPEVLEITAWTSEEIIMGIRHRDYPHIQGVQFHPESILTHLGKDLLGNFLKSLN